MEVYVELKPTSCGNRPFVPAASVKQAAVHMCIAQIFSGNTFPGSP